MGGVMSVLKAVHMVADAEPIARICRVITAYRPGPRALRSKFQNQEKKS
mgnify:CR=1 FL=1